MFFLGNKFNITLIIKMNRNDSMIIHDIVFEFERNWVFLEAWLPRSLLAEKKNLRRPEILVVFLLLIYIIGLYFTCPNWKCLVPIKDLVSDTTGHGIRSTGEKLKSKKSMNSICIVRMKTSK